MFYVTKLIFKCIDEFLFDQGKLIVFTIIRATSTLIEYLILINKQSHIHSVLYMCTDKIKHGGVQAW